MSLIYKSKTPIVDAKTDLYMLKLHKGIAFTRLPDSVSSPSTVTINSTH